MRISSTEWYSDGLAEMLSSFYSNVIQPDHRLGKLPNAHLTIITREFFTRYSELKILEKICNTPKLTLQIFRYLVFFHYLNQIASLSSSTYLSLNKIKYTLVVLLRKLIATVLAATVDCKSVKLFEFISEKNVSQLQYIRVHPLC